MECVLERSALVQEDRWNVEALFSSWDSWEEGFKQWGREGSSPHWPEILRFQKSWQESPERLQELIELLLTIERQLVRFYTYAHLRHDENVAEETAKIAHARAVRVLHAFRQETAWVEPDLLQFPKNRFAEFLSASSLQPYLFYLEKILRLREHTLSVEQEGLLALAANALEACSQAFGAFNNADLTFDPVEDEQGNKKELTHGKYLIFLKSEDRTLRKGAFQNLHSRFKSFENTLCELLNGQVNKHLFEMKARKYSSCLEAALFPNHIDPSVYTSLIGAVRSNLSPLHRYMALRKKMLKLDELHPYDLHVPLIQEVDMGMPFDRAVKEIGESVAILGEEYQRTLLQGLIEDRWVDRYETSKKRSGAYSSGCYDSMPYILMNYHGTLNDVMTLTHEAGHSMHSLLSRHHQPYHYSQYSIFVAEVASTFHEELFSHYLLEKTTDKEKRAFLINQRLDNIRSTLIRQAMFAEFELFIHQSVEKGIPLTPILLNKTYLQLNQEYFGPDVILDEEIEVEWARIPHFYYQFYVYQYATGISAAQALVTQVLSQEKGAKERYLSFLSAGSSQHPLEVLKAAGVDMCTSVPVQMAMDRFAFLVEELSLLYQER